MFLIEYKEGHFVNADLIDWIKINEGVIQITIQGDADNVYIVHREFNKPVVNALQALNCGSSNIEHRYMDIQKEAS